jgi:hypothetical protein
MPGIVPHCVPVETKQNQHGERASTIVVGTERVLTRGKWRTVEVLARLHLLVADTMIGGRRWIGCEMGWWLVGCCGRWR